MAYYPDRWPIPIQISAPKQRYGTRKLFEGALFARQTAEEALLTSAFLVGYSREVLAPPAAAAVALVKTAVSQLARPQVFKWLVVWAVFLFFTCY